MDRTILTAHQLARLHSMLAVILPANKFYAGKLAGVEPNAIQTLDDLARLPFTSKQELLDDQAAHLPYGSNLTYPLTHYSRLHQSSGTTTGRPLQWLDTPESWQWFLHCWKLKYECIGVTSEDRLFFPFSFGPFIGFWAAFEGAAKLGYLSLPGGGMSTSARLKFMIDNAATIVCCTPTYALRLAEVAKTDGIDLPGSPVRMLIVAGEPGGSIPATRQLIEDSWGARVIDHTGMTEIGSLGIECLPNPGGVHMLETECIPEIIDPATGQQVPAGVEGELVLTNLGRWGCPLIRYRTGDRVVADTEPCPCGRPWLRLKGGILGRTDDMIIVRGNNVYPSMIEDVLRRFPEIDEFRLEVTQTTALTSLLVLIEARPSTDTVTLGERVAKSLRDQFLFRPDVVMVPPGSLPRPEMKSRRTVRM